MGLKKRRIFEDAALLGVGVRGLGAVLMAPRASTTVPGTETRVEKGPENETQFGPRASAYKSRVGQP